MDAYTILRRMKFNKKLNESVKRGVRVRLEAILEEHERRIVYWEEHCKDKMNTTRKKEARRNLEKIRASLKITIWYLTPIEERDYSPPTFLGKK